MASTVYQFDTFSKTILMTTTAVWFTKSGEYYYAIIPLEVGKVYKVTLQNVTTLSRFRVAQADSTEIGAATLSFVGYTDTPQDGFGLSFVAEKDYLICYGGAANGGEVVVAHNTIADLTGTTWKFGSKLNADTTKSFLYNVDWTYVITYDEIETGSNSVFGALYKPSNYYFPVEDTTEGYMATNSTLYYAYVTSVGVKAQVVGNFYPNFQSFTVTFTGGADATNAYLMLWLLDNATLVEEEPTSTVITYGGETIATLEAGQTATIKTADTEVEHDIVITPVFPINITYGGETIATAEAGQTATVKCANTEADFDIVVSA